VDTRSNEAAILTAQREQSDLTPFRVAGALLPRVVVGAGVTFNQVEVAFDPSNLFPPDVTELIEQLTGGPLPESDPIIIQRKTAFDASLTLLQPLVLPSAFAQAAGVADAVEIGRANERAGRAQLRASTAELYWAVLLGREAERLSAASLDNARAHEALVLTQVKAGALPDQARLQAELGVSRATREVQAAAARRKAAERALASLTGFADNEPLEVPVAPPVPWSSVDDVLDDALRERPEIEAAEATIGFARTQRLAQQLGWLPTVQARFTESYTQNTGFAGRNWLWNAGIQLNWAVWDGGFRVADTRAASSQLRIAEAALRRQQDDTRLAVLRAWEERERARLALDAVEKEVTLARENLRVQELALSAGAVAFQDVEDARLGLLVAELGRLQEGRAAYVAVVQLLLAAGTLR
jgi:outer membrane protein TolC